MTTEYHIFARRTPRALTVIASSTRPVRSRRGGKRFLNWTEVRDAPRDVHRAITRVRNLGDRATLTVDLAKAAVDLQVLLGEAWHVESRPESAMFPESILMRRA